MAREGDPGGRARAPPSSRPAGPQLEEGARWGVRPAHPAGVRLRWGRTCWTEGGRHQHHAEKNLSKGWAMRSYEESGPLLTHSSLQ